MKSQQQKNNVSIWKNTCHRGFIYLSHDNEDKSVPPQMQEEATVSCSRETEQEREGERAKRNTINNPPM